MEMPLATQRDRPCPNDMAQAAAEEAGREARELGKSCRASERRYHSNSSTISSDSSLIKIEMELQLTSITSVTRSINAWGSDFTLDP
eukprot:COSAG02_NODE_2631_length_8391_cov_16.487096_2_plen_87_part_00